MNHSKKYDLEKNVLMAARERIAFIFDRFENVVVSVSGGKDSTVLAHLALTEAKRRGRRVGLFFLDEEVVYNATIEQVKYLMELMPEATTRYWLQLEFNLTNSVDLGDGQFHCWESKARKDWMHARSEKNIRTRTWTHETRIRDKTKGFGFYDVMENFELGFSKTAFLVGLRADESYTRYLTMVRNAGYDGILWSTKRGNSNFTFYPLYDWAFSDIWKYIGENKLRYHAYYDFAFLKGVPAHAMRVSSLVHEKAFKSIQDLPELEPKTYDKLLKRAKGISFAQETAKDKKMFRAQKLPKNFKSWIEYRDFLLKTYPEADKAEIFRRRFAKHLNNNFVARQQCRQLILNDYENNLPVKNTEDPVMEKVKYWASIL